MIVAIVALVIAWAGTSYLDYQRTKDMLTQYQRLISEMRSSHLIAPTPFAYPEPTWNNSGTDGNLATEYDTTGLVGSDVYTVTNG